MTQIHIVLRRVNPALDVDLAQVGYLKDGQFSQLSLDVFKDTPIFSHFVSSAISSLPYVPHSLISRLLVDLAAYPHFSVDFFDNTLVLMFDFNLDSDESTPEKERKRS